MKLAIDTMLTNNFKNVLLSRFTKFLWGGFFMFGVCQTSWAQLDFSPGHLMKAKIYEVKLKLQTQPRKEKLVLTGLTITLGAFGVHRLYLGTSNHVPVFYTLTAGGVFMIIPVIDLIHILAVKDLDKYRNNPRVFMWGGESDTTQP